MSPVHPRGTLTTTSKHGHDTISAAFKIVPLYAICIASMRQETTYRAERRSEEHCQNLGRIVQAASLSPMRYQLQFGLGKYIWHAAHVYLYINIYYIYHDR
ncbi:hypothetical protein V1515DRAFT_589814 [Lipomyces mesembrius]